jgi:hypothetical protein
MFLWDWFTGALGYLGLWKKSGKLLFLGELNKYVTKTSRSDPDSGSVKSVDPDLDPGMPRGTHEKKKT